MTLQPALHRCGGRPHRFNFGSARTGFSITKRCCRFLGSKTNHHTSTTSTGKRHGERAGETIAISRLCIFSSGSSIPEGKAEPRGVDLPKMASFLQPAERRLFPGQSGCRQSKLVKLVLRASARMLRGSGPVVGALAPHFKTSPPTCRGLRTVSP